jgi:EAL domain-containing protein (putative c-di-GMP-specific phosphodiesterase class I)
MTATPQPEARPGSPYLDHFPRPGGALERVFLRQFPFRLGRDRSAHLTIYHAQVSKAHAEVICEEAHLYLQELGSTNGTFLNGERVAGRALLHDGDIIHLGGKEMRFGRDSEQSRRGDPPSNGASTAVASLNELRSVIKECAFLDEMLGARQAVTHFQPIVTLPDRTVTAYEARGRGQHSSLPTSPGPLFALAEQCQLAVPLSQLFRQVALDEARHLPRPHLLFLNLHPQEPAHPQFAQELRQLSDLVSEDRKIVLEINEGFAADAGSLQRLRAEIHGAGLRLAYDDFGVGQARLAALVQTPADYVKLDRTIVQNLPHSRPLRELVRALGQVCSDLDTLLLAEGVETEDEAAVAVELGCRLGQGYLFAHPMPIAQLHALQETGPA